MTDAVNLTPIRLAWLQKLAIDGARDWAHMPTNRIGARASRALVWGPLIQAGFITEAGHIFTITETGRAVLAKALRIAANKGQPVDAEWPANQESDHA